MLAGTHPGFLSAAAGKGVNPPPGLMLRRATENCMSTLQQSGAKLVYYSAGGTVDPAAANAFTGKPEELMRIPVEAARNEQLLPTLRSHKVLFIIWRYRQRDRFTGYSASIRRLDAAAADCAESLQCPGGGTRCQYR